MFGEAWYEFAFKVGFFKAKFQITAQYTLAGGESAPGGGAKLYQAKKQLHETKQRLLSAQDGSIKTQAKLKELDKAAQALDQKITKYEASLPERRRASEPIDGVQFYYGGGVIMDRRALKRVSKKRAIRESDAAIVARVHDRSDWKRYRQLFD